MMAEIVHDGHAAGNAADLHAALDAFERVEGGLNLMVLETAMFGAGDDGQCVPHIELADEVDVEFEAGDFKLGRRGAVADVEGLNRVSFAEAEAFDRTMSDV